MWTEEQRKRRAGFERRHYPTDLADAEWQHIRPLLPKPARRGRKPSVALREILNAIRYLACAGCGRRMLPTNFGPGHTRIATCGNCGWLFEFAFKRWFVAATGQRGREKGTVTTNPSASCRTSTG